MIVLIGMNWRSGRLRMVSGRHLKPVACSEAEVRATLAQWGEAAAGDSAAWHKLRRSMWPTEALPPATIFPSNAWPAVRSKMFDYLIPESGSALARTDRFLGTPDLLKAVANGWFSIEELGLALDEFRQVLQTAPDSYRNRWFAPSESVMRNHDGQPSGYSALMVENLAQRILALSKLGCLDLVDGSAAIEILRQHQVLSDAVPAGRRILPFPKLAHGTFLLLGQDPIRDTFHALVVLDGFGAVDRIDREACIRGILRFHHGNGLFGAVKQGDGFVIFGESRNTFWAIESLRILGALDQIKNLDRWQFRPESAAPHQSDSTDLRDNLTWSEIEAWVCQERLARIIRERKENSRAPTRSLLEP
jgi:hypothetical protein